MTILAAMSAPAAVLADVAVVDGEKASVSVGGMGQVVGVGQHVEDPIRNRDRVYLYMKSARLRTSATYNDFKAHIELGLGGEEVVAAPSPGVSLGLLDFNFDLPLHFISPGSYLRVGQFKVPYGREHLTYSANSQFVDRSIQDLGFRVGYDVGLAAVLSGGGFTGIAGVFTGGGRDTPARFLPEKLGIPMVVLRAGIGDADDDQFKLAPQGFDDKGANEPRYALFANALFTRDSRIGHSSVLNVKTIDKSLLLNPNWNPYIARTGAVQGDFFQYGVDAAMRMPFGVNRFTAEAEANQGGYSNRYGVVHAAGGRAQLAFAHKSLEVAARYAVLVPDPHFSANGVRLTGGQPIQETAPAVTYYILGNDLKITADLPLLWNVPVVTEKNLGSYLVTDHPDQTSIAAKAGIIERQNAVIGRLMLQAQF
jgi:hypothetical protein